MEANERCSLVDVYLAALPYGSRKTLLVERGIHSVNELTDGIRNELYQVLFLNTKA